MQPIPSETTAAWNRARVRELCALLDVDDTALADGIRRSNAARHEANASTDGSQARRRIYVAGSACHETHPARDPWCRGRCPGLRRCP